MNKQFHFKQFSVVICLQTVEKFTSSWKTNSWKSLQTVETSKFYLTHDKTLLTATTQDQRGPSNNSNQGVLHMLHSPNITEVSQ